MLFICYSVKKKRKKEKIEKYNKLLQCIVCIVCWLFVSLHMQKEKRKKKEREREYSKNMIRFCVLVGVPLLCLYAAVSVFVVN
jgi:small-conductance mechanosensitive channel